MAVFEEGEVLPVAGTELSVGMAFGGGEVFSIVLGVKNMYSLNKKDILSRRVCINKCDNITSLLLLLCFFGPR